MYGQLHTTIDQPFALQKNAITYIRHNPQHAFAQGPSHNPFPGVTRRNDTASSNGEPVPFALNGGPYQHEHYSSGFTEQPTLTSPQTTFAFAISSPQREADGHPGQSAKHARSGSFKRQRLDSSISTDSPYSQVRNRQPLATGQQQYQYSHVSQPGSAVMSHAMSVNPPSSGDSQVQAHMSMSDGNMRYSRSSSTVMAGNQLLFSNNQHPAQTFQNTHLEQFSPGSGNNGGDAQSGQGQYRNNSFSQRQPESGMQISSHAPVTSPLMSTMPVSELFLPHGGFNSTYSMARPVPAPVIPNENASSMSLGSNSNAGFTLVMRQQPERARLCSFKEENDTIDRRPVDPPPIVQIIPNRPSSISEMLVHHHFFMKAILVAPHPDFVMNGAELSPTCKHGQLYQELRLPAGQEATTGEATQTPEKLQDLAGREGAFCVFGRLSIRMPGQFRLRFVLYETTQFGVKELGFVVSDIFEVFSPKLFGGMRQSTTLTRHFASQGLKIKLRQDGTSRSGRRKKAQPMESAEIEMNALEDKVITNDRHQKRNSISRPPQDSLISPRNTLTNSHGPGTQLPGAALPTTAGFPSLTATDVKFKPAQWSGDGSLARYPISSDELQNGPSILPTITSCSQPGLNSNGYLLYPSTGTPALFNVKMEIPINHNNEETLSTIEYALDSSPHDKCSGGSGSSAGDVDMTTTAFEFTPKSTSFTKGKTALPSIGRAIQESSIWLNNAGLVPPDEMVSGGIHFRNGIRYGGDDGFMPPMSFGRLPGLIYDGILPSTPGVSTGNDLSNFSLKNRLGNPSLSPYPMLNNSTPPPPGKALNGGLMQYLNNSTFTGSALSSTIDPSNTASGSPRSDRDQTATSRKASCASEKPIKPSQFADLQEQPDLAAVHGVERFCAALSSSLESKVSSFTLALPKRTYRGSKGSLDEPMRDAPGDVQPSLT
ncbi:hypothetical protein QFC22_003275 [Naganishia vaughanmartiniae]|uniref:Uncharacterized protein n=1 Tax=Naganishia vaughanmartiniae TaxID=1424756 RepID=A0ACC2X7Z8_9TREE|nr:hypothetical protein QFC22_003275 [Naganishia vaughanmartiniae]